MIASANTHATGTTIPATLVMSLAVCPSITVAASSCATIAPTAATI